jgi:hypothetical protein
LRDPGPCLHGLQLVEGDISRKMCHLLFMMEIKESDTAAI